MNHSSFFSSFLLVAFSAALAAPFSHANAADFFIQNAPHDTESVLVQYQGSTDIEKLPLSDGKSVSRALKDLARDKSVVRAEPNYEYRFAGIGITPNDPGYASQAYLRQTNVPEGWSFTTGSPTTVIAVLDSGVDVNHPDLRDNIWMNKTEVPGDGIDNDKNGFVDDIYGWDFINDIPDPEPKFSDGLVSAAIHHGTLIAGVAAATGNNRIGSAGVSWRSKIMPLRVLNNRGEGDAITVVRAIDYAIEKKVDVINMSFVGPGDSSFLKAAIKRAHDAGIVIVAASGNDEQKHGIDLKKTPMYPVCYDFDDNAVIGIASTDPLGQKANFSNYGPCIDISVPGTDFYSTQVVNYEYPGFESFYGAGWSGTSLSTAVVSGAVALLKSVDSSLRPRDIMSIFKSSSDGLDRLNPDFVGQLGFGRVNVGRAIDEAVTRLGRPFISSSERDVTVGRPFVAAALADGKSRLALFDAQGNTVKSLYPFQPYKIPFTSTSSREENGVIVVGAGKGGGPQVRIFNAELRLVGQFFAYDTRFRGGVSVAMGDVDGDGVEEIITAPLTGGGPHVKVFDQRGRLKAQWWPYAKSLRTGLRIAVGDVNGDGKAEVIVTPQSNYTPEVRVFDGTGGLIKSFVAYDAKMRSGVSLAVGDTDGDGLSEIVTAPLSGLSEVRIFAATGFQKDSFLAFPASFHNGVSVAMGDADGNGLYEIVAAPARRGGPQIRTFSSEGNVLGQFFAFPQGSSAGLVLSGL